MSTVPETSNYDSFPSEKCDRCRMISMMSTCLVVKNGFLPPKCKDGTCNLAILNSVVRFNNWKAAEEEKKKCL